jgi:hypothetical protein
MLNYVLKILLSKSFSELTAFLNKIRERIEVSLRA